MERKYLLAAETFRYSFARYAERVEEDHVRYTKYMPEDISVLERAERENWDDVRLAQALEMPEENATRLRDFYRQALEIIDAPTPAEAFRRGVRHSIRYALEEGLKTEKDVEDLVVQICYRAADLGYMLDMARKRLSDYSRELRKEPGVRYLDDGPGRPAE